MKTIVVITVLLLIAIVLAGCSIDTRYSAFELEYGHAWHDGHGHHGHAHHRNWHHGHVRHGHAYRGPCR
jgi:hypothetical protein